MVPGTVPGGTFDTGSNFCPLAYEGLQSLPDMFVHVCPKPLWVGVTHVVAVATVHFPLSHVVSGIVNCPFAVCIACDSCTDTEYPLPALVETIRSWQPW